MNEEKTRLNRFLPALVDGLATAAAVYLFFLTALQFRA